MREKSIYLESLIELIEKSIDKKGLANNSVLITGATGLIGSAIADVLLTLNECFGANIEIILASRSMDKLNRRFLSSHGLFVPVEYEAMNGISYEGKVDYIIHCASNAHPLTFANYPVETIMTNVLGTKNIFDYAKENDVRRILYISSSEVYGEKENNDLYFEEDLCFVDISNPRSCYPSSKRVAENLCASYYKEYGVESVIVRPGHIYGPTMTESDTRAHAQFARDVIGRKDIVMKSPGLQLRSYCHVFDCVSAILTVLLHGEIAQAYNISNNDSVVTIKALAEMHAKIGGQNVIFEIPSENEKSGYNLMTSSALNADKLYNLGWRGIYDVEKGVKHTLDVMKCKA